VLNISKELDQTFYVGTFGDIVINDSTTHCKAGTLTLSKQIHRMISSMNLTSVNTKTRSKTFGDSPQKKMNFMNQALQKGEYYGNITLRSENAYLKSHVNELEEDIKKLYECNDKIEKVNKSLDMKLNFYQKKVHCFNEIYNIVIKHINSIFKKVGEHILEGNKEASLNQPSKELAKQKLNGLFESEMMDLKQVFKNLQKQIKTLNEEYSNIKQNSVSEDTTRLHISKILDSISSLSGSELKARSTASQKVPPTSLENTKKINNFSEENSEYSKYDLPLSHRSMTRQANEIKGKESSPPRQSAEKKVGIESSISPSKNDLELKEIQKKNHALFQGQRRNIPPSPNISLRNEITKRIVEERSLSNSRHNSVHQISYLNYSGVGVGSQRGSVRTHNNPSSFHADINNSGSQLNRQSSEKMFGYKPLVSTLSKLNITSGRQHERSELEKSESAYNEMRNNFINQASERHYRSSTEKGTPNPENGEPLPSNRDSYDNLKSFRKLIQSFRGEVKMIPGQKNLK
jgi:cell division protein FtsB